MKQTTELPEKVKRNCKPFEKNIRFQQIPKAGQSVMVFMGADVYPDHKLFQPSRYGIVQHIITEPYTGSMKGVETIDIAYIKECAPIDTFNVDFFFPEKRVYFVE